MAKSASTDLELIQCIAFAVKACKQKSFTVPTTVFPKIERVRGMAVIEAQLQDRNTPFLTFGGITVAKEPNAVAGMGASEADVSAAITASRNRFKAAAEKYVARPIGGRQPTETDIRNVLVLDPQAYFYDLVNNYAVDLSDTSLPKQQGGLVFFLDKDLSVQVTIPHGFPVTEKLLQILPKRYLLLKELRGEESAEVAALTKLETAYKKLVKAEERLEEALAPLRSMGRKPTKGQTDKEAKLEEVQQQIKENRQAATPKMGYIRIVSGTQGRAKDYSALVPHLRQNFPWTRMLGSYAKYSLFLTKGGDKMTIPATILKTWNTGKLLKRVVDLENPAKDYVIYDQSSPFTETVKNEALAHILDKMQLSGLNEELLSPVDLFIVNRRMERAIMDEIQKKITNNADVLLDYVNDTPQHPTTYKTILQRHFDADDLVGVSLKLPEKVGSDPFMKVMGEYRGTVSQDLAKKTDPFTRFLMHLIPSKMDAMIDDLITIQFDKFDIKAQKKSWSYPVIFNYDAMKKYGLQNMPFKLEFLLMTWDKAGFNGQWAKNNPVPTPGNWTGGYGMTAANFLFSMYTAYDPIVKDLAAIRKKAMDETLQMLLRTGQVSPATMKIPTIQAAQREAERLLSAPRIIGRFKGDDSPQILRFTRLVEDAQLRDTVARIAALEAEEAMLEREPAKNPVTTRRKSEVKTLLKDLRAQRNKSQTNRGSESNTDRIYTLYQVRVIERLLSELDTSKVGEWTQFLRQENQPPRKDGPFARKSVLEYIDAHYIAVQFSWFLLRGGRSQHLALKKKLFLSVFGLITKSGYKSFETFTDAAGNLQTKDILRVAVITPDKKRAYATFSNAPYVMFS